MADSAKTLPRLFNIAAGQDFLATLAHGLADAPTRTDLFGPCALHDVQILLPTRRAARQLAAAFVSEAAAQDQQALLLPRIDTLGDLDDDVVTAEDTHFDLPPAIEPLARHFHLLPLVAKWAELGGLGGSGNKEEGDPQRLNPVKLSALAYDLESFLDQAQNEQIDLARLPDLVPDDLAENWQQTLALLNVVTDYWPQHLQETGHMDPTARRNAMLAARRAAWAAHPPAHPVIAAGSTGSIQATADLLRVIAELPKGAVVLPGLDMTADDAMWQAIEKDVAHPQNALAKLLQHVAVGRGDVAHWPRSTDASARADLFNLALVPAVETARWAEADAFDTGALETGALKNCHIIEAPDMRVEAGAIALVMRETLQQDDKSAALVTRDRNLARRVAAELRRWGIEVDDSAGRPLGNLPRARFLRLLLACHAAEFEPVALLALLKHPMVHLGVARGVHLACVRRLENLFLRGPRPVGGLAILVAMLAESDRLGATERADVAGLLARLETAFAAFDDLDSTADLAARLDALLTTAGFLLAESPPEDAYQAACTALYAGDEEGRALAALLARLAQHSGDAPVMTAADFPALLDMWLARQNVRQQVNRAPRLSILGPLEARLMQCDVMILGGLNETVWPPMPETGPWLSRPMRAALGMSQPERQIGQAAHDFVQAAAAPEVYLTRSEKIDGSPAVASRWLRRLETLCGALPRQKGAHLMAWWRGLDMADEVTAAAEPTPCPPLDARPDSMSVTQIEKLLHNPYEVYASKILRLRALDAVAAPPNAGTRGTFLHRLLETHIGTGQHLKADATALFLATAQAQESRAVGGAALMQFWRARLQAVAHWLTHYETQHAAAIADSHVEVRGDMDIDVGGKPFRVTAIADRIDRHKNGQFDIIDYKTGALPSKKSVKAHLAPQLTLEAAILRAGGFKSGGGALKGEVRELSYLHLTGRDPAGHNLPIEVDDELLGGAVDMVARLIAAYREETQSYRVHIRPRSGAMMRPLIDRPYDHLARLPEWQSGGEDT